ncbi:MAG: gliding motility-associated C-terminal domain-containing protein [Bacteroidales bacterium]|nr:gliding motility-associated C-terminal domain-containing protein [Bacteroidales bacterium]
MNIYKNILVLVAVAMLTATPVAAQEIVSFAVPTSVCSNDTTTVSFGYRESHNIVIEQSHASLGHSEQVFLPDGQPCGTLDCSYRSPVTFTDFADGAIITSVNDIQFLRLNMEHSFLGDLYINITCPNGRKADILRFSNYNGSVSTSICQTSIGSASRGWNGPASSNEDHAYLGIPNRTTDNTYNPCNHTSTTNAPGTGWNYCWSNNTNSGYTYADGSGYVYRSSNQQYAEFHDGHNYYRVDSSNVATGANFYHPDESFASLVGCPMNGEWYIEVIDGVNRDNGYIFEWELSLNPTLLPPDECEVTGYNITGHGVTMIDDSTFTITPPAGLSHDTTIAYTYTIYSTCGAIDSTVNLTFHPSYHSETTVEGCESYTWKGNTYTTSTNILERAHTPFNCDSISRVHIVVHPGYHLVQSRTIVENQLPFTFMGSTFDDEVADSLLTATTTFGCDSNVTFTLTIYRNVASEAYDTICSNALPYQWNGLSLGSTCDTVVTLFTTHGADSVITLHLQVFPAHDTVIITEVVENELPVTILGREYYASIDTTLRFTNGYGCDSVVTHRLTVHENHSYSYTRAVCDSDLPCSWNGAVFDSAGSVVLSLLDRYGADSIVTLTLNVNPTYIIEVDTIICDNYPYVLGDQELTESGKYKSTLTSALGCDSTVSVSLMVNLHDELTLYDTICANDSYTFGDRTYNRSGTYIYNYTNVLGCDSIITLNLGILAGDLKADILAIPLMVSTTNPNFDLHDNSDYATSRLWIIEDNNFTQRSLSYTFPDGIDSLPVTLVAYSPEGCSDTAHTIILMDRSAIFTPNAFTPNQSTNNTWQPVINKIEFLEVWIYNRTGLLVTHLEGTDLRWDGTSADGIDCPQGAYVYNLQYRTIPRPEKLQSLTGTILLIR